MRNIHFEELFGSRFSQNLQMARVRRVIAEELTDLQREALIGYYFDRKSITDIAAERGVNKSTVCRTLHRAVQKLRRFLAY